MFIIAHDGQVCYHAAVIGVQRNVLQHSICCFSKQWIWGTNPPETFLFWCFCGFAAKTPEQKHPPAAKPQKIQRTPAIVSFLSR